MKSRRSSTPVTARLYYAFGLNSTNTTTLSSRREALALTIGKHPDTIERYENQGIAELAAHLTEQSTQAASNQSQAIPLSYLQQLEDQVTMARTATKLNLAGLLFLDQRAEEFVQYLETFRRPYLDATIDIKLKPSRRGKSWYRIEANYRFRGRFHVFRVAAVTNNADGEHLIKQGLIHEFHKLNDMVDPSREMEAIVTNSTLVLHNPDARKQKLLRFQEIEGESAQQILQSADHPLRGSCRLLEIVIPTQWENTETIFEYRNTINLREDLRYAYWYAPGIMYVKKLTFDYSQFPDGKKQYFKALPFLGYISGDDMLYQQQSFTLELNNWVMPGHGIGLTWEPKST